MTVTSLEIEMLIEDASFSCQYAETSGNEKSSSILHYYFDEKSFDTKDVYVLNLNFTHLAIKYYFLSTAIRVIITTTTRNKMKEKR